MEFLFLGDMNSSVHSDRSSRDAVVNEERRKLIDLRNRTSLEILNGIYGEDAEDEMTFINRLGRSVTDYAFVSEENGEI